jgi:serine protease inhibitor
MLRPVAWLAFLLTCMGCLPIHNNPTPRTDQVNVEPKELQSLVEGSNQFALDLYAQLEPRDGNLFFSPYSVSTALSMTSSGARGQTLEEMTRVLPTDGPRGRRADASPICSRRASLRPTRASC